MTGDSQIEKCILNVNPTIRFYPLSKSKDKKLAVRHFLSRIRVRKINLKYCLFSTKIDMIYLNVEGFTRFLAKVKLHLCFLNWKSAKTVNNYFLLLLAKKISTALFCKIYLFVNTATMFINEHLMFRQSL